ncbi:MAG: CRTAC1 family protein, partial [bacterium]
PLGDDEFPDLLVTHGAEGGAGSEANELFRNDGGGALVPVQGTGLDDPTGRTRCASAADYDGDLRVDVWLGKAPGASPNSLLRNVELYSFTDVAAAAGLDEGAGTVGGIWGDYDDDGDPDLFVGGEEFPRPSKLFRNDGGTFADATGIFSPAPPIVSGADRGDFDEDGDLDLALCDGQVGIFDMFVEGDTLRYFFNTRWGENGVDGLTIPSSADTTWTRLQTRGFYDPNLVFLGPNEVHPPLGPWAALTNAFVGEPSWQPGVDRGTFVWRQFAGGPWEIRCSSPLVNADAFDGLVREGSPISGTAGHDFEDENFVPGGPRLFRNDGGAFTEVTAAVGLPDAMLNPRDISWVDFDNDGDLDLHVVDQGTSETLNAPDALFRNDGGAFVDVAAAEGALGGTAGLGDGAVWGDVDRDGDLDVYVAQGAGPRALGGNGPTLFYRNDAGGSSVLLDLVGSASGPAPIGAKVTARIGSRTLVRWLAANSWRGFADPVEIHLGLGAAAAVDTLGIEWPSGIVQILVDVAPGFYRVDESPAVDAPAIAPAGSGWRIEAVRPQPARGVQAIVV